MMKNKKITVASYNLKEGGVKYLLMKDGKHLPRVLDGEKMPPFDDIAYELIAEDIVNVGADIIGFQEVAQYRGWTLYKDSVSIIRDTLEELTGEKWYSAFAEGVTLDYSDTPNAPVDKGYIGVALVSKFPIISTSKYVMPCVEGKSPNCVLLEVLLDVNGKKTYFYVSHYDQGVIHKQMQFTYDAMKNKERYILAGDFNWQRCEDFERIFPDTTQANNRENMLVTTHDGYRFDNLIFSQGIEANNFRAVNYGHSDHFILLADMAVE
ncbi:MAG: endonuclease/exonuclease/phosphatase family protein [Clostridia bacterium]|nr:endonuclease/exonuclease/phosphatase family protein [Clostridia bacterium]